MKMNEIDKTNLSEEDWIIVGKTFNFMKAAAKAREGQSPDTMIEFECPVCGGKARTGYASYNGHPWGNCDCGLGFIV